MFVKDVIQPMSVIVFLFIYYFNDASSNSKRL